MLVFHCVSLHLLAPAGAVLLPYLRHPVLAAVYAGHYAIDIFLVLAGYLMAQLLLDEHGATGRIHAGRFVARRFVRIAPLYVATMALYMAVDPIQRASCARWGWASLLFVNNFFGPQLRPESCLGHGWTLAVEFQLYLASPLVVAWMLRRRAALEAPALLSLAVVLVTAAIVHGTTDRSTAWYTTALYDKPYGRAVPFLAGMGACAAARRPGATAPRLIAWLALAVALALLALPPEVMAHPAWQQAALILGRPLFGVAIAILVYAMRVGGLAGLRRALSARVWLPVARLSYAAYLVQFVCVVPVVRALGPRLAAATTPVQVFGVLAATCAVAIPLSFALGLVGYLAIERPFMNLRR